MMAVQYPSHLYIRIDRSLRAELSAASEATGQSVSAFARGLLRASVTRVATPARVTITSGTPATRADGDGGLLLHGAVKQSSSGAI